MLIDDLKSSFVNLKEGLGLAESGGAYFQDAFGDSASSESSRGKFEQQFYDGLAELARYDEGNQLLEVRIKFINACSRFPYIDVEKASAVSGIANEAIKKDIEIKNVEQSIDTIREELLTITAGLLSLSEGQDLVNQLKATLNKLIIELGFQMPEESIGAPLNLVEYGVGETSATEEFESAEEKIVEAIKVLDNYGKQFEQGQSQKTVCAAIQSFNKCYGDIVFEVEKIISF